MVILNKTRLLYYRQNTPGAGVIYREIAGSGVFKESLKTIGKYALLGLRNLWKNSLKPKAITLAKEGAELGKDLFRENKGNIQKVLSRQSENVLKKLLSKDRVTKQDIIAEGKEALSSAKDDLMEIAKENRDSISQKSKQILDKLLYGEGLKILR